MPSSPQNGATPFLADFFTESLEWIVLLAWLLGCAVAPVAARLVGPLLDVILTLNCWPLDPPAPGERLWVGGAALMACIVLCFADRFFVGSCAVSVDLCGKLL